MISTVVKRLSDFWTKITNPHPALVDPEDRRRARLLSAIMLVFMPSVILAYLPGFFTYENYNAFQDPIFPLSSLVQVVGLGVYVLSRTSRYQIGAYIMIIAIMAGAIGIPAFMPEFSNLIVWLIFAYLMAGLLVQIWVFIVMIVGSLALSIVVPILLKTETPYYYGFLLVSVAFCSVFLVLFAYYRKRDMEEVRRERASAEAATEANLLKTEFLATMSHELRTPLNVVIGNSQLILMGATKTDGETRSKVERIHDNANRLLLLINDVLTLTRMEAGRAEIDVKPFAPADLLASAEHRFGPLAAEKNLEFITSLDPNLPETLSGDQSMLEQIIKNLVSNAIKFTDSGFVKVACGRVDTAHWQISVSDSGPGIPKDAQLRIFERFTQGDSSARRAHGGAGLGLALVREFAALLDGVVRVDSEPARGSVFSVLLPVDPAVKPTEMNLDDTRSRYPAV